MFCLQIRACQTQSPPKLHPSLIHKLFLKKFHQLETQSANYFWRIEETKKISSTWRANLDLGEKRIVIFKSLSGSSKSNRRWNLRFEICWWNWRWKTIKPLPNSENFLESGKECLQQQRWCKLAENTGGNVFHQNYG